MHAKQLSDQASQSVSAQRKSFMKLAIKVILSLCLLGYVLSTLDLSAAIESIQRSHTGWLALSLAISLIAFYLNTKRWHLFCGIVPFMELLKINWIARYYSLVLPGQLSGDLLKAWRLGKGHRQLAYIAAGVFLDKAIAVVTLFLCALVGAAFSPELSAVLRRAARGSHFLGGMLVAAAVASVLILFFLRYRRTGSLAWLHQNLYVDKFNKIVSQFRAGAFSWRAVLWNSLLSFAYHGLAIALMVFVGWSVDVEIGVMEWTWVYGFISVFLMLPISFAGIGIRDASLVGFLGWLQVPVEQAFAVSLLHLALTVLTALPGALIETLAGADPHRPRAAHGRE